MAEARPPAVPALIRVELRAGADRRFDAPLGRLVHGTLFQTLAQHDPAAATALHAAQDMPLTISPLMRGRTGAAIEDGDEPPIVANGERVWLTLGVLDAAALRAVGGMLARRWRDGSVFPVGHVPFRIEWIGLTAPNGALVMPAGYEGLLASAPPAEEIALRFVSPALLRTGGEYRRFPEPRPVLLSYLRRWNAHAPTPLDRLDPDTLERGVQVADADIATRPAGLYGERAIGLLGLARYRVRADAAVRVQIAALARFAPYCGTGARTLYGMGQTECLLPPPVLP